MPSLLRKAIPIFLILACPVWANAAYKFETFKGSGFGGYAVVPADFDGSILDGTLSPGTFVIEIDDASWPVDNPATSENERWDYVFANYFVYDDSQPGAEGWTARFPPLPAQVPVVTWNFYHNGDKVGGVLQSFEITISDGNHNGIVDPDELNIQAMAGNLTSHIEQNTGIYEGYCGIGSMNGTLEGYDLSQPYVITITGGNLILNNVDCQVPAEQSTWGAVKQIYSE